MIDGSLEDAIERLREVECARLYEHHAQAILRELERLQNLADDALHELRHPSQ